MIDYITIPLTQGKSAIIDKGDATLISGYSWHAMSTDGKWYAEAYTRDTARQSISMHRLLMQPPEGYEVDHVNGNGLDCTRANMRNATVAQNRKNRRKQSAWRGMAVSSQYKGICWKNNRWEASIASDKKWHYLGRFTDEVVAARAYDAAARHFHKDFAALNFPDEVIPYVAWAGGLPRNNTSGFRGVNCFHGRWHAQLRYNKVNIHLGYHETPEEAARAYDAKARELLGAKAKLNFPD